MAKIEVRRKPIVIGVMGGHKAPADILEEARRIGAGIAKRGHVILTGGGAGVMKAASEGAFKAGGLVLAVLPSDRVRPLRGYPNDFVDIAIYTGMADARNAINAKTPHIIVAVGGGWGTVSEIALAMRNDTPVIGLKTPSIDLPHGGRLISCETAEEALAALDRLISSLSK
ncbi:MAG TPA: TIGR00725 family protein [Syntrophales bacterium]|nr:TIGR00725 family protein [Syntrophales bacterium]